MSNQQNERTYLDMLATVFQEGERREDRTGVGTLSMFGMQARYDLRDNFPLLTTKRVYWKGVVHELLWFLSGSTNAHALNKHGVHIWDEWADEDGRLGPVYGAQWRQWEGSKIDYHDQIAEVIKSIQDNPTSRRHIVSAWAVHELSSMALPPCHLLFQFYVSNDGHLDCQLYQRSGDLFLGVPFNIASYSLLTMMVAQVTGLKPRYFVHTIGDAHVYLNHTEQVKEQLSRDPIDPPRVFLNPIIDDIDDFTFEDIDLVEYQSHPAIKAPVAV
jgi:thymidylate synthase